METPATPTSARRADVVSAGPGPGPSSGTGTVPAASPLSRRAALSSLASVDAPREEGGAPLTAWRAEEDERGGNAATGRRTDGATKTRRLTSRFVSVVTGAAPIEGWVTPRGPGPGRSTRNEKRDENKSALTKKKQNVCVTTKLDAFASTPEGTPLSQVFKATKSFGGSSAAARQTQAFVTPVEKAFSRSETAAESPGFEGVAARAKRRRA